MKIELLSRGRIRLPGAKPLPNYAPMNALMGMRSKPDSEYDRWLAASFPGVIDDERAGELATSGLRDLFTKTATGAQESKGGKIEYEALAPRLSQIAYRGGGLRPGEEIDVPSFEALAAWSLVEAVARGDVFLFTCERCKRPAYGRVQRERRYCERPAPGKMISCAQLEAFERFGGEHDEYQKEYRRIYGRKRRESIPEGVFERWTADNRPGERGKDWFPFEEWYGRGRTKGAREALKLMKEDAIARLLATGAGEEASAKGRGKDGE